MKNPIVNGLLWRAALKSFHPVPPSSVDIQPVLDAVQLAPSAYGVQPYDIHVITDDALKAKLRNASYNQQQVTDCSHLLVFCAHTHAPHSVNRFINSCQIESDAPDFASFLHRTYDQQPLSQYFPWAANQAYLALGVGVTTAAEMRVGACPMSGFVASEVADILQLPTLADYIVQQGGDLSTLSEEQRPESTPSTPAKYLSWPVAYLAIGSSLDDAAWHEESRKQFKRRRILLKDLVHWHGAKTTKDSKGAVEIVDEAANPSST